MGGGRAYHKLMNYQRARVCERASERGKERRERERETANRARCVNVASKIFIERAPVRPEESSLPPFAPYLYRLKVLPPSGNFLQGEDADR